MSRYLPLILFTVVTNAAAQIMLKEGVRAFGRFELSGAGLVAALPRLVFSPLILLGLFTFVVSMASHIVVLSRVDLSFAYPFLSIAYVIVTVYAFLVFKEDVNLYRIAGIALICAGTILISRS